MKYSLGGMKAATALTQSGKLLEATALIQRLLSKNAKPAAADYHAAPRQQAKLPSKEQDQKIPKAAVGTKYTNLRKTKPKVRSEQG
jgi:hypothetical protein